MNVMGKLRITRSTRNEPKHAKALAKEFACFALFRVLRVLFLFLIFTVANH
jgi:hypothetical protein